MNDMMNLIQSTLEYALDGIKSGKIYATEKQMEKVSKLLANIFSPTMTRLEVMEELGICDTTLRKKIKEAKIPKGRKIRGKIAKTWVKNEIEGLLQKCNN